MNKRFFWFTALVLGGCAAAQPLYSRATLVIKPQIISGAQTLAVVNPYSQSSINHLVLKVFSATDQDLGLQQTLLNAQLDNPVVFSNLKAQTTYRVKAFAYSTADNSQLISTSDASSSTDIVLTNDDRPTLLSLRVQLIDRAFNAQASSSLVINPGGYSPIGGEAVAAPFVVSPWAGNGAPGFVNGLGTAAKFNLPHGVTLDFQGNLYVLDYLNHGIRKITAGGLVSTLAGSGVDGFADAPGTQAQFRQPVGLAVDLSGNVYVADTFNHRIRKVTSAGVVTTIAGNGTADYKDGTGSAAMFNYPFGVAVDASGTLYVADGKNNRIRRISTSGVVSTLAGSSATGLSDGNGTAAVFANPVGLTVDDAGNLYIADESNNAIRKVSAAGVVTTLAGNGNAGLLDGVGTAARLKGPVSITRDAQGNLFFADRGNNCIRKLASNGSVTTLAGTGSAGYVEGTGTAAMFDHPFGIAVDAQGVLYVGDTTNHRIRRLR